MSKGRSTWGSIRKRGKESWEIRYSVGGKSKTETIRGSRSDAERRLSELRIKYEGATADVTLSEFWDTIYLPDAKENLAPSTVAGYKRKFEHDIRPEFGDLSLNEIGTKQIQKFLLTLPKTTAKHCKVVLSSVLNLAITHELIDENVAQYRYRLPKQEKAKPTHDVYTMEELDAIFHACRGEYWEGPFILAAFGGAQRGEATGVKLEEFDFRDGFAIVPIRRSVQRIDGEVIERDETKVEVRAADVIVPPPYSERLREIVEEGIERGDTWLLDDGCGNPNCPGRMAKAYERWFQKQPFRYIPFSNLRNAYSTALHKAKLEDSTVSKLMRHSNLTTDYKHYNRLNTEDKIEALKELMGNIAHNCP